VLKRENLSSAARMGTVKDAPIFMSGCDLGVMGADWYNLFNSAVREKRS